MAHPDVGRAFVEQSSLGPESRCDLLRKSLKELGKPIYRKKVVLWISLREAELVLRESRASQRAADEHLNAQAQRLAPIEAKGVVAPAIPTKDEREEHELTHIPAMPWCEPCVPGAGVERPHVEDLIEGTDFYWQEIDGIKMRVFTKEYLIMIQKKK